MAQNPLPPAISASAAVGPDDAPANQKVKLGFAWVIETRQNGGDAWRANGSGCLTLPPAGSENELILKMKPQAAPRMQVQLVPTAGVVVRSFDLAELFTVTNVARPPLRFTWETGQPVFVNEVFASGAFGGVQPEAFLSLDTVVGTIACDTGAGGAVDTLPEVVARNSGGSASVIVRLRLVQPVSGLVRNGDFASADGWNLDPSWKIIEGLAFCNAEPEELMTISQPLTHDDDGSIYDLHFKVTVFSGSLNVYFGTPLDPAAAIGNPINTSGSYKRRATLPAGHERRLSFISNWFEGFVGTIDNVFATKL